MADHEQGEESNAPQKAGSSCPSLLEVKCPKFTFQSNFKPNLRNEEKQEVENRANSVFSPLNSDINSKLQKQV